MSEDPNVKINRILNITKTTQQVFSCHTLYLLCSAYSGHWRVGETGDLKFLSLLIVIELPGVKGISHGQPGWLSGLAQPSAWGMILGSRDRVPCQASCEEPASPSAYVSASLTVSLMNK